MNLNWQPGVYLKDVEKQVIKLALKFYRGNKTQTSIALGISLKTLDRRIEQYAEEDTLPSSTMQRRGGVSA